MIVVDEFGKVLEHAAKNNPEQELYFMQKLAEFVNVPSRQILLLTTLHQNFSSYARGLSEAQRNEWTKVKGRFKEIPFVEPIEQLLFLASQQLQKESIDSTALTQIKRLSALAKETHFDTASCTCSSQNSRVPCFWDPVSLSSVPCLPHSVVPLPLQSVMQD